MTKGMLGGARGHAELEEGVDVGRRKGRLLAQPGSAGSSAIPSLPGGNRTFSNPGSTLQQRNTRQLIQFALLCSSFTTSGFTQPRKSRAGRPLCSFASGALTTPVEY
jgi:hypothetical protein